MSRAHDLAVSAVADKNSKILQDITTLALRQAIGDNHVAYNLPNSFIDQFEDATGVGSTVTANRHDTLEYWGPEDGAPVLINGLVAHWGTADAITRTVSNSLLLLQHSSSPDSDDGIFSYGASEDSSPATPYKFAASTSYAIEFKPHSTHASYNPYFFVTDATYSGAQTTGWSSFNTNTWKFRFMGYTGTTNFHENGSVVKSFVDAGIQNGTSIYKLERDGSGNMKVYRDTGAGSVLFHTFAVAISMEQQMWFSGQGGTGTAQIRDLKYAPGSGIAGTATVIGIANVPSADQTKVSGVMLYKDAGSAATVLGTDLRIYFTCNGDEGESTVWTEVLLADMTTVTPEFSTGIKMVKLAEKTCTSGDDIRYKAVWANQVTAEKETQLHGIGLNY